MKTARPAASLAILAILTIPSPGFADPLDDARRILKITNAKEKFEIAVSRQASDIVRTYASIVVMSTDQDLPPALKQEIERCYRETYAWGNFEDGIARLFAENLDPAELRLLLDFYRDRSVPPPQIARFRDLITKADAIEQLAIDYMFNQSEGCDEKNVQLILSYLASRDAASETPPPDRGGSQG